MSDNGITSHDPVEQLKDKIAKQKQLYKSLETELENPRLLNTQIESLTEVVKHLPERLNEEIDKAKLHLAALQATRDSKLVSKSNQLIQLTHRRDNLQDLYIQAWDDLQAMNKRLKTIEHSDTLDKLKRMREAYAKLSAELPDHLKNIESVDELKALEEMVKE